MEIARQNAEKKLEKIVSLRIRSDEFFESKKNEEE
jgi:hypothetical protein